MDETELLFTQILDCSRTDLYLNKDLFLTKEKSRLISAALRRRLSLEPIQYILGRQEFMGLEFKVTPDVLIPRQETEILVGKALRYIVQSSLFRVHCSILDIGTGSGCIAISLARLALHADIIATDISEKAIDIARYNAGLNKVGEQIKFIQSDLFSNHELCTMNYELIISNPPYIPSAEVGTLQPEIQYEPRIALDGGQDGLDFYRRIITQAPDYLKENGILMLEMGIKQREPIEDIFKNSGNFEMIEIIKDYSDIERVVVAKKIKL